MKRNIIFALTFYIAILCIPQYVMAQSYLAPTGEIYREEGIASWYGPEFDGRPTASGEIFNSTLFTAAHPSLPFGTFLIITNRSNNRQVTVKVNDRGPFVASRNIDVSKAAAEHLDMIYTGVAPVIIETLPTSYLQSPPGSPAVAAASPALAEPQPPETAVPEPEPVAEPPAQTPGMPGNFPYPPITVNVYPSAQPPAQAQPDPQHQPQAPQYQPQPQYPPQPQYQAQPQYPPQPQYQSPQSAYPFPAPVLPTMQPPYQESYIPPPAQPVLESPPPAPTVRLIPAINPLPGTTYRLQVGSYKAPRNAVDAFEKLKGVGLNPAYEQHGEYYRVVLARIPGTDVLSVVDKIGRAGFREAMIRVEQ
jgi:rare lipoprotein A